MTDLHFLAPQWFWLLLWLPLVTLFLYKSLNQDKRELARFNQHPFKLKLNLPAINLQLFSFILFVVALAQPVWNPVTKSKNAQGRNMIILLDVSRSMLAADARPNRLTVATQAIKKSLAEHNSDQFGLAVFAGSASILSPLTSDRAFLRSLLEQITTASVPQGGTHLDGALLKITDKMLVDKQAANTDILLITDGEDLGQFPSTAISQLNEKGVRLVLIGLGDSLYGARVPNREGTGWVKHNQREHWSKMAANELQQIADKTNHGLFLPVGTATFDLSMIIDKLKILLPPQQLEVKDQTSYSHGYPICLLLALLVQIISLISGRRALLTGLLLFSFGANADEEPTGNFVTLPYPEQVRLASALFENEPYRASEIYQHIAEHTEQLDIALKANYNYATSLIHYALLIESGYYQPEELEHFDEDEELDPEPYFEEAANTLRRVLHQEPQQKAAAQNLEWLTIRAYNISLRERQDSNQEQQGQNAKNDSKPQDKQQAKNKEKNQEQDPQLNDDEIKQKSEVGEASDGPSSDVILPAVNITAKQVLSQLKTRDQKQRLPKTKKQQPVEKDW